MSFVKFFLFALLALVQPRTNTAEVWVKQLRAIRGPMRILWIRAEPLAKAGPACTVTFTQLGRTTVEEILERNTTMSWYVNPGERAEWDFAQTTKFIGTDFKAGLGVLVNPNGCANVMLKIERPEVNR